VSERSRTVRWATAIAVSIAVVGSAPYVGDLQRWLRGVLGSAYLLAVNAVVAARAAATIGWAALALRDHRWRRGALLAAAVLFAGVYARWSGLASAESNAVERFHFVAYSVITLLFHRAAAAGTRDRSGIALAIAVCCAWSVGAADEWIQHLAPGRIGEFRDICINLAAIGCGVLLSLATQPLAGGARTRPSSGPASIVAATVALLLTASFLWTVHGGTLIEDEEVAFLSRYDREALVERSAAGAAAPTLGWGVENQYVTEAIWHVQARNERWTAGDIDGAGGENRILEKYFASALSPHAWAAAQRDDAERRRVAPGRYRSHAERLWIFVR
jgi:hypothetical protein